MNSWLRRFGRSFLAMVFVQAMFVVTAYAVPMSEKEKIDALIHVVETRNHLQFVRLGSVHSASEAAQMLRSGPRNSWRNASVAGSSP